MNGRNKELVLEGMDDSAQEAFRELPELKSPQDVARWFRRHYLKAGYRRLSQKLMSYFDA